jgi:oligopeptide transport system substrate-binding protein
VFLATQSAMDYDLSASSWIGDYNDPNTFLDMWMSESGNNRTGWKSPRYDQLLRDGNSQTDQRRREDLLQKAEALLVREEVPIVPLWFYKGICFFDGRRVSGIYFNIVDEHPLHAIRKIKE